MLCVEADLKTNGNISCTCVCGLFNVRLCAFTAKDFYFLELVGIPVFH